MDGICVPVNGGIFALQSLIALACRLCLRQINSDRQKKIKVRIGINQ